ncbi:hypothetical protein FOL47_009929 [Perkinsus chesapeaki]|uniref:Uncharacterized protein n=1 Tax=Perkinsus chesapeaki TaxID=330153 RepID=A0A7J6L5P9_PERCH|nr:hypothetical protein FOL47_009929 [Perkinsus chesapeaki]
MTSESLSIEQQPQDGQISIRVELVPQLFANKDEQQQEMVYETERVDDAPIVLEAWGECPDEEGLHDGVRVRDRESRRSSGRRDDDDGLAEACASLDLLLEKQSTIESLLNLRADEMNAIDKMHTMCMQAESMGGEIIAVANSLRSMRSFEEQAEYYSAVLTEIENEQDEVVDRIRKIRGGG